jgi:alanine racemase
MITTPARILISRDALWHNYTYLKKKANTSVACVVKANGYGLGVENVVPVFNEAGCQDFFVAHVSEGIAARQHTKHNIYVLHGFDPAHAAAFEAYHLIPVLSDLAQISAWGQRGPCVWHIDTGMNRLGIRPEELDAALNIRGCDPTYILSHLISSEEPDNPINRIQLSLFLQCREKLKASLPHTRYTLSNSSGIFLGPDFHFDMVRPGYALYGGNPLPHTKNPMRNVVSVKIRINNIHKGFAGETVGYNQTHTLRRDSLLAVVEYGYADGLLRTASNRGAFYIDDFACRILGRVSMDLTVIDITDCPIDVKIGDEVELLGTHQTLDQLADICQTNGWEILTRLSSRAQRIIV